MNITTGGREDEEEFCDGVGGSSKIPISLEEPSPPRNEHFMFSLKTC